MTTVRFNRTREVNMLEVYGHQQGEPTGKNIYCAGISAICCTLAAGLAREEDAEAIKILADGGMKITAMRTARGDAMFDMAMEGLSAMAAKWPDRVKIEME